jgi:hypothetical protein
MQPEQCNPSHERIEEKAWKSTKPGVSMSIAITRSTHPLVTTRMPPKEQQKPLHRAPREDRVFPFPVFSIRSIHPLPPSESTNPHVNANAVRYRRERERERDKNNAHVKKPTGKRAAQMSVLLPPMAPPNQPK